MLFVLLSLAAAVTPDCIDVRNGSAPVSLEGRLERTTFTMRDIGNGAPERVYILTLSRPICIEDGGEFADPGRRFGQVQLYTSRDRLWRNLRGAVHRQITIRGSGFPAQTAHHHAPLVVDVSAVSRTRR